jgi:hypothetical protein
MEVAEQTGSNPIIMASIGSVLLSWYFYFMAGNREAGLFVGLWAPTLLAFGSYFRQTRMHNKLNRTMGRGGVVERVEEMIQSS